MDSSSSKTICVTEAAGFIGSWLVMRLLERGYTVRATVRDPGNTERVKHLLELPNAETNLSLWKADLSVEGSFDEAIKGCVGVFHVASPMDFEPKDPEKEVIKPAINGVLDILKACVKAESVKRIVFTSSAATINWNDEPKSIYDETSWSDIDFFHRVKMTGWMYFVSKTEAEQEAWKFSKEHNLDFISIIPTLTLGPFLGSSMPPSLTTALSLITGNEAHYSILKQCQYVHIDDLCLAHIFLYENPEAQGRYICSSHDANIHDIANFINERYPHHYNVPTTFKDIPDQLETIRFSSKKLKDLGFQFKYSLEDMYDEAIETCLEKGLLPNPDIEDH